MKDGPHKDKYQIHHDGNAAAAPITNSESPHKYVKSVETAKYSKRSNSKRSTLEDELRSLSTTPRMSHEDYGRIVSPPSSDPPPYEADELLDDMMDMQLVNHESRHTDLMAQMTNQRTRDMIDMQMSNRNSQHTDQITKRKPRDMMEMQMTNHRSRQREIMDEQLSGVHENHRGLNSHADTVRRDLKNEHEHRKVLEKQLDSLDEDRKELNVKIATLRVKLGVANANNNVSKTESDQLRKKFQEIQVKKARLEERISNTNKEVDRLKDPNNPDSNVNMKKTMLNDRKEIRKLRQDLEAVKSERSETQKQLEDRDTKIKQLKLSICEVSEELDTSQGAFDVAKISAVAERKKREEIEALYNDILEEKVEFDNKMAELQSQLDTAISGNTGIMKLSDEYKEREQDLQKKIDSTEKKLRDVLTEIEQQKNRDMPVRTASSIKHHQYRMANNTTITDTTPHVIVTTNPKGSIAASGYLGKSVVQTKPVTSQPSKSGVQSKPSTSLPSKPGSTSKPPPPTKGKAGSLSARK